MRDAECEMQDAECGMQNAECKMQDAKKQQKGAGGCGVQIVYSATVESSCKPSPTCRTPDCTVLCGLVKTIQLAGSGGSGSLIFDL